MPQTFMPMKRLGRPEEIAERFLSCAAMRPIKSPGNQSRSTVAMSCARGIADDKFAYHNSSGELEYTLGAPVDVGRPRSEQLHQAILTAALDLVLEMGFRVVSIEAIAAKTGIAKTTIYRRWPNKAALIMEGFLTELRSASFFPEAETALERIRLQMHVTAKAFRGRDGALVKDLVAETQFDPGLAEVYRNKWTLPRRKLVIDMLKAVITQGALRPGIDIEGTIDLLYAPIYYRLLLGTGPISNAYIEILFAESMKGLQATTPSSKHRKH